MNRFLDRGPSARFAAAALPLPSFAAALLIAALFCSLLAAAIIYSLHHISLLLLSHLVC